MSKRLHLRSISDVEGHSYEGGFDLSFHDDDKGQVVLHLSRWWLVYISNRLWDALEFERQEVERKRMMRRDPRGS